MRVVGDWAWNANTMSIELLIRHAEELEGGSVEGMKQNLPLRASAVLKGARGGAASKNTQSQA